MNACAHIMLHRSCEVATRGCYTAQHRVIHIWSAYVLATRATAVQADQLPATLLPPAGSPWPHLTAQGIHAAAHMQYTCAAGAQAAATPQLHHQQAASASERAAASLAGQRLHGKTNSHIVCAGICLLNPDADSFWPLLGHNSRPARLLALFPNDPTAAAMNHRNSPCNYSVANAVKGRSVLALSNAHLLHQGQSLHPCRQQHSSPHCVVTPVGCWRPAGLTGMEPGSGLEPAGAAAVAGGQPLHAQPDLCVADRMQ